MSLPREIALDDEQMTDMFQNDWNCRIATVDAKGRINLTPMWFGWADDKIFIAARGQKVVNIRRNPNCTILIDRNEKFPELQAIMMQGTARILETAEEKAHGRRNAVPPAQGHLMRDSALKLLSLHRFAAASRFDGGPKHSQRLPGL